MDVSYGRPRSREDWLRIRDLCGLTAMAGKGIPAERWPFFGEYWVGPYEALVPEWTYVARIGAAVQGYLTGCPDTLAFEWKRDRSFYRDLFNRVLAGEYAGSPDARDFRRRSLGGRPKPLQPYPAGFELGLRHRYPAHLHVNVDACLRGKGAGAGLMERYCEDLRKAGIPGVHLYCGAAPVGFYRKLGFSLLCKSEVRAGAFSHAMGRKL
jgi:hypothetical protein